MSRHYSPRFININIKQAARIREFQISIWSFIFILFITRNWTAFEYESECRIPAIRSADPVLKFFSILNNHPSPSPFEQPSNRTAASRPKTRNNKFSLPVYRNFGSIDRWIDRKFVPSRVQSRSIMILDDTRTSANVELDFPIETTFSHHLRGVSLALVWLTHPHPFQQAYSSPRAFFIGSL